MDENIVEASERATVGEVREEVRPGQIVVVENQINIPVGILSPESVIGLPHAPNLPLIELREELDVPALAVPDTSLKIALRDVLRSNGVINWYVLRDEDEVAGAVSSENIFQAIMGVEGVAGFAQNFSSVSTAMSSMGHRLWGISYTPVSTTRYRCPDHPTLYNEHQLEYDDAFNYPCPEDGCLHNMNPIS